MRSPFVSFTRRSVIERYLQWQGTEDDQSDSDGKWASETVSLVLLSAFLDANPVISVGGIIAAYSFLAQDAPKYKPGFSICMSFICLSAVSCIAYYLFITNENRKRDRAGDEGSNLSWEEKQEMGDLNPDYRYLI